MKIYKFPYKIKSSASPNGSEKSWKNQQPSRCPSPRLCPHCFGGATCDPSNLRGSKNLSGENLRALLVIKKRESPSTVFVKVPESWAIFMLDGSGWTANKSWECQAPKTFCQIWSTTNRQICEKRSQGKAKTRLRIKLNLTSNKKLFPKNSSTMNPWMTNNVQKQNYQESLVPEQKMTSSRT